MIAPASHRSPMPSSASLWFRTPHALRSLGLSVGAGVALLALALFAGCGSETDPGGGGTIEPSGTRYLPLAVGATWTWRVSGDATYDKTSTVEALEDVGGAKAGIQAYRVRTTDPEGDTVSWQQDTGTSIVRHREQTFSATDKMLSDQIYTPGKLRIDESDAHMAAGSTFVETYTEQETDPDTGAIKTREKSEMWIVEAVNEPVSVPAGTFNCVRLRRTGSEEGASDKRYWFARGIGKVKETGGQTEELASFTPGNN
jgi:hypothetical protein